MIALPLLVLTVTPVVVFHITGRINMWFAPLAVINALGASFDVLVAAMVLRQVPARATIRNNGWDTYWRPHGAPKGGPAGSRRHDRGG